VTSPVRVLLVGLMATGKSTVGRALSEATGWQHVDNDVLLERRTGSTAARLLAEHGEQRLRAAESDVLTLLLALSPPLVAGIPAGVVLDAQDRRRLRAGGHVVWLRAPVGTLVRRVAQQPERAWLGEDPAAVLERMARDREPLYAEVAHQVVDVEQLRPAEVARQVLSALPPS
jgi:shikimate kinase